MLFLPPPPQHFIDRKFAGTEGEDDHTGEQEEKRRGGDEGIGVAPDRFHDIEMRGEIGDGHSSDEWHADDA